MEILLALTIGWLYGVGIYMLLRRSLVKLLIGLMLLGHAANLLIFTMGRLERGVPPLIPPGQDGLTAPFADPVPQALVLTAVVIGFGVQAFAVVLLKRSYQAIGTDDLDRLRERR